MARSWAFASGNVALPLKNSFASPKRKGYATIHFTVAARFGGRVRLAVVASITHTTLNLLTSEGTVTVFIVPGLEPDQYSDLHELVLEAETADQLRDTIRAACDCWGREVHFG